MSMIISFQYITGGLVPSKNFGKDYSNLMADYMQKAYEVGRSFGGTAIIVGGQFCHLGDRQGGTGSG